MSNVIDFLERMGQDAKLRYAVGEEFATALAAAGIDPAVRAALVNEDRPRLEALLGASANVCSMVHRPEEPDEGESVEEDDDADLDDDDDDDDDAAEPKLQRSGARRAASSR
jgi:hypothetical protein